MKKKPILLFFKSRMNVQKCENGTSPAVRRVKIRVPSKGSESTQVLLFSHLVSPLNYMSKKRFATEVVHKVHQRNETFLCRKFQNQYIFLNRSVTLKKMKQEKKDENTRMTALHHIFIVHTKKPYCCF